MAGKIPNTPMCKNNKHLPKETCITIVTEALLEFDWQENIAHSVVCSWWLHARMKKMEPVLCLWLSLEHSYQVCWFSGYNQGIQWATLVVEPGTGQRSWHLLWSQWILPPLGYFWSVPVYQADEGETRMKTLAFVFPVAFLLQAWSFTGHWASKCPDCS